MTKNTQINNKTNSRNKKSFEEVYNNMCILKRDLYYKDIVNAHKDVLVRKTTERIEDIFHCYKQHYISTFEMFTALEELRCKNHIIDHVIQKNIMYAKKTFCKPRGKKRGTSKGNVIKK